MLLEVSGLSAGYGDSIILNGVSIGIEAGSITAVIGSNGAGKTTLMRTLSGLLPVRTGTISFAGSNLGRTDACTRVDLGMSLVPEGRLVFPDMSVQDTLRVGAYVKRARAGWQERRERIYDLFPRLRERKRQRAGSLSGGEQQMLALGRGLMAAPTLLLLDEPSLGLAPVMSKWIFESIRTISATGVTICLVEQDVRAALRIADAVYVLEHGEIVQQGSGQAMLDDPKVREHIIGL
jgi:branched-chain amino acid transport system ATP-binding protein